VQRGGRGIALQAARVEGFHRLGRGQVVHLPEARDDAARARAQERARHRLDALADAHLAAGGLAGGQHDEVGVEVETDGVGQREEPVVLARARPGEREAGLLGVLAVDPAVRREVQRRVRPQVAGEARGRRIGAQAQIDVREPEAAGAIPPVPSLPEPAAVLSTLPGAATEAPAAPLTGVAALPARIYTVRGVTKSGRPGPPSTRVELPLVDPPAEPPPPQATATERSIVLTWPAQPASTGPIAYNIYRSGSTDPINGAPLAEQKYERAGVTFGTEECFTLRAVQKFGAISIESNASPAACLTPRDTFAPAAPKGLSIVAGTGTMNLGWDANTEADLAGYVILRGEAPGDTLQPLTPAPITATSYEDKTVKAGVRYVYAIVAVDKASPPNRSAPSARVEETAR